MRWLRVAIAIAVLAAIGFLVEESRAELENQVFTSRADRLRIVVPRGWRATDQASYPGLLLWMMKSQPPGQIVLTAEPFTRELYCSWPADCRALTSNTAKYACALRRQLTSQRLHVGPAQLGPKENEAAGAPSMWFEYEDKRRFLRQAIAVTDDRAISLVLSAPTADARAAHVRPFDQTLRTLERLPAASAAAAAGAPTDAGVAPSDAGGFSSAPVPERPAVGPCPTRR